MQKSRIAQSQSEVIHEARELRSKLIQIKQKKEQQHSQLIRTELSELYNLQFEQFKSNLQQKIEDQLTSLELTKELRMTEITDVENRLKECMVNLEKQQNLLKQDLEELSSSYLEAAAFLDQQENQELEEWRSTREKELLERVANYKESIDIQ